MTTLNEMAPRRDRLRFVEFEFLGDGDLGSAFEKMRDEGVLKALGEFRDGLVNEFGDVVPLRAGIVRRIGCVALFPLCSP